MVAIARDFSGIVGMADTNSYFVKEQLVAFYTITPQMLQHMSQGTWRHPHMYPASRCTYGSTGHNQNVFSASD
jgi:hypothetical protein